MTYPKKALGVGQPPSSATPKRSIVFNAKELAEPEE
jgi:hypothetical protein